MTSFLFSGLMFGLSAGFSPGPLMTLIISQTLTYGVKEGLKVSLAPLITDLPVILLSILVLSRLSDSRTVLGIISLLGGLFVLKLAYANFRIKPPANETCGQAPKSLLKGTLVNFLSPNPYLFWLTVGTPLLFKAWDTTAAAAVLFLGAFYLCLIGGKVTIALAAGKSRQFLTGRPFKFFMAFLGVLLAVFAITLLRDGLNMLGVI